MMDWVDVTKKLPEGSDIVWVKRKNGSVVKAYFHEDEMDWIKFYTKEKITKFQEKETLKFLDDVTHWK